LAKKLIPFEISLSGADGGSVDFPISINDPMWGARDDITNQRMRFLYQSGEPLSLEQQRLLQALENQAGISHSDVIVSDDERESPFPIGCPSGFFQEGNVCVPIIGTYPDETYNAPPAGQNFARGVIDHIEVPPNIVAGQQFSCKVFIRNIGAVRGKFGIGLIVDTWNLDITSPQGWVPRFTPAVIEVKATCPANATIGDGTIPATFELQKLDEVSREYTIDDVANQNLPQPRTNTPIPPTIECFTYNNKQYCLTTNPPTGGDCITIGTKIYCTATTTPPQPQCFEFNDIEYCESDEITGPNCVQIGTKIFCPTGEVPCPSGQEKVNGHCVPVCPTGYSRNGAGACVPQTCPAGQQFDVSTGTCKPITCPPGYDLSGNNCIPKVCPTGQQLDLSTGTCKPITCPPGYVLSGNNCVLKTCPTGQQLDLATGTCKPIQCPNGYDLVGNNCVPKICPTGTQIDLSTGQCKPIQCPTGYHLEGNVCKPNAPPPPPQCITIGGVEFCQSDTWKTGCVFQDGKIYCIKNPPPPPPPPEDPAVLLGPNSVRDGDKFTIKGFKFKPGERVDMELSLVWRCSGSNLATTSTRFATAYRGSTRAYTGSSSYCGDRFEQDRYEIANSSGSFEEYFETEEVPSGVSGTAIIRARGQSSGKTATLEVDVI
jgi:hypothetical protein